MSAQELYNHAFPMAMFLLGTVVGFVACWVMYQFYDGDKRKEKT